jgi:ATP-binding cassette subfamily C (CFTR/MRP) protein 1
MNALIRAGFKTALVPEDLYPIDAELASETLDSRFWTRWSATAAKAQLDRSHGGPRLVLTLFSVLKRPLLASVFPRILLIAVTFCQPLLISRFLSYLLSSREPSQYAWALVGAYAPVYTAMALLKGWYWH